MYVCTYLRLVQYYTFFREAILLPWLWLIWYVHFVGVFWVWVTLDSELEALCGHRFCTSILSPLRTSCSSPLYICIHETSRLLMHLASCMYVQSLPSKLLRIIGKVYLSLFDFLPHSKSLTNSTGTCPESVIEVILRARLSTGLP